MTVVVAAVYGNKGVITSDSLVVSGDKKVKNLKNFCKLIKFPKFVVGFAGNCAIYPVIYDFAHDRTLFKKSTHANA